MRENYYDDENNEKGKEIKEKNSGLAYMNSDENNAKNMEVKEKKKFDW